MPSAEADRVEAWNWQCWRTFKTKPSEWVGFFESEKHALAWTKSQPGTFVVNNVPPPGRNAAGRKVGDPKPWKTLVDDMRADAKDYDTKKSGGSSPAVAVKPKVVKPPSPEERKLKANAAKIYEKHKADEAAELAQEG